MHGAGANRGVLSHKPSTKNGIIRPATLFLAWLEVSYYYPSRNRPPADTLKYDTLTNPVLGFLPGRNT